MAYSKHTNFFRIPYMGEGNYMTEEDNSIQMSIIDNILYSFSIGYSSGIIKEGTYSLETMNVNNYRIRISANSSSGNYSLCGILNHRLFYSVNEIKIEGLLPNINYYIYLERGESLDSDPTSFKVVSYQSEKTIGDGRIFLCSLSSSGVLDFSTGKEYIKNIYAHMDSSSNPHGGNLIQDNLEITGKFSLQGKNCPVFNYIKFPSPGPDGSYSITADEGFIIKFISFTPESFGTGEIIYSLSPDKKTATVENSGGSDIMINARIDLMKEGL